MSFHVYETGNRGRVAISLTMRTVRLCGVNETFEVRDVTFHRSVRRNKKGFGQHMACPFLRPVKDGRLRHCEVLFGTDGQIAELQNAWDSAGIYGLRREMRRQIGEQS